ncbi:MAG: alpha/beta fold hydrolase, partial [Thermoleophilaceae bacterium]|nr:alpha/beta fold hydrolase [Thermoleophilaceae bacterium]
MSHPIVEHRLELGGTSTRALDLEGEGPPLVLLHGFGDSADTWRLVLDRLRRAGRAGVALDLPGFGTAGRLDREEPILPQLDRFVAAAVKHYDNGRGVILAGNSLG